MHRDGIMQLTDTLIPAGSERVAVNFANSLAARSYNSHLCTTRAEGALAACIDPIVGRLQLARTRRFEFGAVATIAAYCRKHHVGILHAHGSTVFVAVQASLLPPFPAVLWHNHYGRFSDEKAVPLPHRLASYRMKGIVAVSERLAEWSRNHLHVDPSRVWYLPNYIMPSGGEKDGVELPGNAGKRIVCVANFVPEKDHPNLLRAMAQVLQNVPDAHLILVGNPDSEECRATIERMIRDLHLESHVSWLGRRTDVPAILRASTVGVLPSWSEGFPMVLLEYGMAGLPVVSTATGQCPEILDGGRAGVLVPPRSSGQLAAALVGMLRSAQTRDTLASSLKNRVASVYGEAHIMDQLTNIYTLLVNRPGRGD